MGEVSVSDPSSCGPSRRRLLGPAPHRLDSCRPWGRCGYPLESQKPEAAFLLASHLDQRRTGQTQWHRTLLWTRVSLFSPPTPTLVWLVGDRLAGGLDLRRFHHYWFSGSA